MPSERALHDRIVIEQVLRAATAARAAAAARSKQQHAVRAGRPANKNLTSHSRYAHIQLTHVTAGRLLGCVLWGTTGSGQVDKVRNSIFELCTHPCRARA